MLWFDNKPKCLPLSSGSFVPGCVDIMLNYDRNGTFLRLFYPTNAKSDNTQNWRKWIPWIPDFTYVVGISKLIQIPLYVLRFVFWWYGNFHIPALYGEKIRTEKNMKCVIISHGLGGSRFLYSTIASDLASHGLLVACLEHRDESACNTYYFNTKEDAVNKKKTPIYFRQIPFGENHYEQRNAQIKIRSDDCLKAIEFLKKLNNGIVPKNILDDVEVRKDYNFCLDELVGKIDIEHFSLMGHSFGAATVLYTIPKTANIKQAILLDPWMFPIKNENLHESIDVPLLFINTQTFHIDSNVKVMAKFMSNENRKMYTIRQSTHENQTDTVIITRYWLNIFMTKIDPYEALRINNALIFKFLHDCINVPSDVEKYQIYLNENSQHFEEGLTKPWQ